MPPSNLDAAARARADALLDELMELDPEERDAALERVEESAEESGEVGERVAVAKARELLRAMDDPERLPVLVHCYHGSIRSAALEGLYRREYMGETGPEANDRTTTWGHDLSVKYPEIYKFIEEYVPRRDREKK